jgi:hypothetical protein
MQISSWQSPAATAAAAIHPMTSMTPQEVVLVGHPCKGIAQIQNGLVTRVMIKAQLFTLF